MSTVREELLEKLFRKGKELAIIEGNLWDELSGAERNQYYSRADELLAGESEEEKK